jgi:F420-non-reducing hydrogenase small subunit
MNSSRKLRIGVYWASSCGGCDISLLEIGEKLLELVEIADIAFWPCVADFKYATVAAYPDAHLDLCLFNGGIRNSEQEQVARLLRQKSRTLIAYGTCAADGGIPALANLYSTGEIFRASYHDNPSIDNPAGVEPCPRVETSVGTLEIPQFYPAVLRLRDVVDIEYAIPGCPPDAENVWETIAALTSGAVPAHNGDTRIGCNNRSVCDECKRQKRDVKITTIHRPHQFRPEPEWCLLEQGILCMGSVTRGGCDACCPKVNMRCEGCFGPPPGATDQGASMIGALSALLDASTETRARELTAAIPDPTGTFYRFSMSSSRLKAAHQRDGGSR